MLRTTREYLQALHMNTLILLPEPTYPDAAVPASVAETYARILSPELVGIFKAIVKPATRPG